jgi:hypothetical protein
MMLGKWRRVENIAWKNCHAGAGRGRLTMIATDTKGSIPAFAGMTHQRLFLTGGSHQSEESSDERRLDFGLHGVAGFSADSRG